MGALRVSTALLAHLPSRFRLQVGPLTSLDQAHCLSTHLTTFAGGFLVLPEPLNWNYVFANADFMKNKTIYLTVIVLCALFILLMLYARYKDRKDRDRVSKGAVEHPNWIESLLDASPTLVRQSTIGHVFLPDDHCHWTTEGCWHDIEGKNWRSNAIGSFKMHLGPSHSLGC